MFDGGKAVIMPVTVLRHLWLLPCANGPASLMLLPTPTHACSVVHA